MPAARPQLIVRDATGHDAAACAAIYGHYVEHTVVSFESEPPSPAEMARRIGAYQRTHAWLVAEDRGRVVGYAYACPYRERAAYRWSCEVSVYLEPGRRRTGTGTALYQALFARLGERGYRTALAAIALPNPASEGFHRAMGFELIGVLRRIGWKHGAWRDVVWMQRHLAAGDDPPVEPR